MKTSLFALLCFVVAPLSSGFVEAAPQTIYAPNSSDAGGIYVGTGGGVFWLQDFTVGSPNFNVTFKYKTGGSFNVPVGFDFGNGFKASLSVGYSTADYDSIIGNFGGQSQHAVTNGNVYFIPVMASVSYSYRITGRLRWEFGAGIGTVYVNDSFTAFDGPARQSITFGQLTPRGVPGPTANFIGIGTSAWDFGFQAFTGLTYDITDDIAISAGYRYLYVGHNASVNGIGSSGMSSHQVEGSLIFKY